MRGKTTFKILFSIIMILSLSGCNFFSANPVPLPEGFCDQAGERSESHLLKIAGKLVEEGRMTPDEALNATFNFMIRGAALAQVVDKDARAFLQKWWKEVGIFYLDHVKDGLTWDDLIGFMFSEKKWGEKVALIKIVVDPNYQAYGSIFPISGWDDCALQSGHKRAGELFNFGAL